MNFTKSFNDYLKKSPNILEINYWDLPESFLVEVNNRVGSKPFKKLISIKELKFVFGKNPKINKKIKYIIHGVYQRYKFRIKLPISLINKNFVKLYSLMLSEGDFKNTFKIQVPEEMFHNIFRNSLIKLFGPQISPTIKQKIYNGGIKISYATKIIHNMLPIPECIPKFILQDKEFARTYLKLAFESEGYAYLKGSKRYIRLTRNIGIDHLITENLSYMEGTRIAFGKFKKEYPIISEKIKQCIPITLLGEHLILKHHFNIESTLLPENILVNKTNFRKGKTSVRWSLCIYADSIDHFIKEINFLSKKKKKICKEMGKIKANKPAYFCLKIMKEVSKNNIFKAKDFRTAMKKLGYITPQKYIWFYKKRNKIQRTSKGVYKIIAPDY